MTTKALSIEQPLALIVDDDTSMRISMRAALIKAGFAVIEARNGLLALDIIKTKKNINLVLLDVMMPGLDGFETCAAIRQLPGGKYIQILMVTGLDDTESIDRAFEAGANDFVTKPLNWAMLGYRANYMLRAGRSFKEIDLNRRILDRTQKIARIGNWEVNLDNGQFNCSPETKNLLGLNGNDALLTLEDFLSSVVAFERDKAREQVERAIKEKSTFSINYQIILPSGHHRHIFNQGEIGCNEDGASIMLGAIQDVTKLKVAEEEIRRLAFYDGLTGLANRMLFFDRLDHEIGNAERHNQQVALLFLDLDNFKLINDTHGHHVGDLILKNVSQLLEKCTRCSDNAVKLNLTDNSDSSLVSRLGGDEFLIMLTNIITPGNAAAAASRIIDAMPRAYNLEGYEIAVSASIGISFYPTDADNTEMLVQYADSAMYQAKNAGKNNYQFFNKSLNTAIIENLIIKQDIRKALDEDEFRLYYQPQIDLTTRKIVGAEALIRWPHPDQGMIPPDTFLPIAEESGLIVDINRWLIRTTCRQNREWLKAGLEPVQIAINLSGHQLASQNIIKTFKEELARENNNGATNLEVEITEEILLKGTKAVVDLLENLKAMNIAIALDDFGTGYSSLGHLTSFHVDTIKIDRSLVMGSTLNNENIVIIKAIIAMGHSLGMKIKAEGIETAEQFALMKEFGVDEAQGFYFKPAVPHEEFVTLLANGTL